MHRLLFCRGVIICELIVRLFVIEQNKKKFKCKSLGWFFSPAALIVLLLVLHGHYFDDENVPRMLCFETPCHMCTHIAQCKRQKHD